MLILNGNVHFSTKYKNGTWKVPNDLNEITAQERISIVEDVTQFNFNRAEAIRNFYQKKYPAAFEYFDAFNKWGRDQPIPCVITPDNVKVWVKSHKVSDLL